MWFSIDIEDRAGDIVWFCSDGAGESSQGGHLVFKFYGANLLNT